MRHISKVEGREIRADIKYLCKKGMPTKEIYEDSLETLGKESPSYTTVKLDSRVKEGKIERER